MFVNGDGNWESLLNNAFVTYNNNKNETTKYDSS